MNENWSEERAGVFAGAGRGGRGTFPWTPPALILLGLLSVIGYAFRGAPPDRSGELDVEHAGCRAFLRPRLCVLPADRRLTLWLETAPGATIELWAGGAFQPLEAVDVQGGRRLRIEIPEPATELVVRVREDGSEASWTLPLGDHVEDPRVALGLRHIDEGRYGDARALLREALADLPFEERGPVLRQLATIAYNHDRDRERALQLMRLAIIANRRGQRLLEEVIAVGVQSFWLFKENRFSAAREILDGVAAIEEPGDAAASLAYYRGLLARETGDLRSALRLFHDVAQRAVRLDVQILRRFIPQNLLLGFRRTGRDDEAERLFGRLSDEAEELYQDLRRRDDASPGEHCALASLLNNLAWDRLMVLESGDRAELPITHLERALEAFRACGREHEIPDVETNLALAHLHAGQLDAARGYLTAARSRAEAAGTPSLELRLWWLDVEGRLALHDRRPRAAYDIYGEMAELAFLPEARWSATVGQARALDAMGQPERAVVAFAEAERLLDEETLLLPMTDERHLFLRRRELATRSYLELLLRLGHERRALAVARRARSRVLRTMERDERQAHLAPAERNRWDELIASYATLRQELEREMAEEWRLPRDRHRQARARRASKRGALERILDDAYRILDDRPLDRHEPPPPRPGEVLLIYHPLTRGWIGFAQDQEGIQSHRFAELEHGPRGAERAPELLAPFAERIARAERVRFLPYGFLRGVDVHALPFGDDVLLAAKPVVYGLDLPAGSRVADRRSGPPRALLVVDPTGDLPAARTEAGAVRETLRAAGLEVDMVEGVEASGAVVRARLAAADLLHFAGHGEFGGGGWDSALPLADGARLTVGDILTLPRVPANVVLSGCETARASQRAPAESVASLAYAFLVAGSDGVVATPRPVDDRVTARMMTSLYREWVGGASLAVALQRAQLELRRRGAPPAEWASFRVVEP